METQKEEVQSSGEDSKVVSQRFTTGTVVQASDRQYVVDPKGAFVLRSTKLYCSTCERFVRNPQRAKRAHTAKGHKVLSVIHSAENIQQLQQELQQEQTQGQTEETHA